MKILICLVSNIAHGPLMLNLQLIFLCNCPRWRPYSYLELWIPFLNVSPITRTSNIESDKKSFVPYFGTRGNIKEHFQGDSIEGPAPLGFILLFS